MRIFFFLLLFLLAPERAFAQAPVASQPRIEGAPAWAERLPIPAANPALRDRPIQTLLSVAQSRYGTTHNEHYAEGAFLIQNGLGLQGLGNVVLPWRPDQSEIIVHKVQIIRGSTVIDLLANGQRFTVLRRENNLESAELDGVLTAVMQPEGLAVGDTLHLAFTMRERAGALPLRGQNLFALPPGAAMRRYYVRQIWPEGRPMRWRGTGALATPTVRRTAMGTELVADVADIEIPQPPPMAPTRFALSTVLQVSDFRDWAEVGASLAPHFASAAELQPESPLRARIDEIAGAGADPRARLMAALRLVQDEVRYFALVMGDGNYLPATADQSWSRRFADCKGKAVLLIALLRGLGIEAEPVLVAAPTGDGLDERLPQMILFNHMIVRARIDGRSYWLDGTRRGDRVLEDLASSPFAWGLPVRGGGSDLERLPVAAPSLPLLEQNVTYDVSRGFAGPIPVSVEWIYRGDLAEGMRMALSQAGREEFLRGAREVHADLPGDNDEVTSFDLREDAAAGAFILAAAGKARMEWRPTPGESSHRFRFDNEIIRWTVNPDRPAGPGRDAPYAFPVPTYYARTDVVILPDGGRGFAIDGRSIDEVVAGTRISRRLGIADGRATARSEFRRLEAEVSAATMRQAVARLDTIGDDEAYLAGARGATGAATGSSAAAPSDAAAGEASAGAEEANERGYNSLRAGDLDEAAAAFERAASLNPRWSRPLANHAIVQIHRGKYPEAEALLARAQQLDPSDFVIFQGRGLIDAARNRPVQAVVAFSRALELQPNDSFTLMRRSRAYQQLGEFDDALADLDAVLAAEPGDAAALNARARIHAWRGDGGRALAAADAAIAAGPGNPLLLRDRGLLRRRFGQGDAAADFAAAVAIVEARIAEQPGEAPALRELAAGILADSGETARAIGGLDAELGRHPDNPQLLNARCWVRATANVQLNEALADCERALRLAPDNPAILDSRAFVKLRLGQFDGAIADAGAALEREPNLSASLYVRGVARLRKGERQAGEQDLAAARRVTFDIDSVYRDYGVTP